MTKIKLSTAAQFFYDHAMWGYDPVKETSEQGRIRNAQNLAGAEGIACDAGYSFEWCVSDVDSSEFSNDSPAWSLYDCIMRDSNGKVLQSLSACDFGKDATGPYGDYRRVVEAELANIEIEKLLNTLEVKS